MSSEVPVQETLHSITLKFDAETAHRAKAIYHATRVEKMLSENVRKSFDIEGQFVNVKLESKELSSLKKSSNNLLKMFTLLSDVVKQYDVVSPSTEYSHF